MRARDEFPNFSTAHALPGSPASQYARMCDEIDALRAELVVAREDADRLYECAKFMNPPHFAAAALEAHAAVVVSRTKEPQ